VATHDAADDAPFHPGERAIHERLGIAERMERGGRRMLGDSMAEEDREFFEQLPFILIGTLDATEQPWASWLGGPPGFVSAPTPHSLLVGSRPEADDPLVQNLRAGAPLGALGIELETRHRIRANGHVVWTGERGFELRVEQSFGNCRKYIQARTITGTRSPARGPATRRGRQGALLGSLALDITARADTAFLATASAEPLRGGREGVDVSHRGGRPGFLRAEDAGSHTRLTLPDFYGNFMFNSFGNLEVNPRAGLLVVDFENGDLLSLTGAARVLWNDPRVAEYQGAERLLVLDVHDHVLLPNALRERWSAPEYSAQLAGTGWR